MDPAVADLGAQHRQRLPGRTQGFGERVQRGTLHLDAGQSLPPASHLGQILLGALRAAVVAGVGEDEPVVTAGHLGQVTVAARLVDDAHLVLAHLPAERARRMGVVEPGLTPMCSSARLQRSPAAAPAPRVCPGTSVILRRDRAPAEPLVQPRRDRRPPRSGAATSQLGVQGERQRMPGQVTVRDGGLMGTLLWRGSSRTCGPA